MLKIANDHKRLPGFSDRNVRRYLPSYNPNIPRRVRTPRPKNSATISVDSPKLSISEHKQNEIMNTSTSTDMDCDVTKVSQLQLDKHEQIEPTPHHRQPRLQSHLLIILLHNLIMMIIKCKITIFCPLSFGYRYERSWDILFQLSLKRSIQKIKYGLVGFLTKVPVGSFRLPSEEQHSHKMTS
jgi:hypothetical protein